MNQDQTTLNLAAAVLCTVGSAASVLASLWAGGPRDGTARAAMVSGLLGMVGSAAWALAAYQDKLEAAAQAGAEV
ncbi:MAG: hypothetical protein AAF567_04680 [Actinomycetota bacterium]